MFAGFMQDETTSMLDSFGDDIGWSIEDVTHWAEINLPYTEKGTNKLSQTNKQINK